MRNSPLLNQFKFTLPLLIGALGIHLSAAPIDELLEANANEKRLDLEVIANVYNDSILEHESINPTVELLMEVIEDESTDPLHRTKSWLSISHLYWRYGQFEIASDAVDTALEIQETTDGTLLKARLLDAQGKENESIEWYTKTLESSDWEAEEEFARIRLAMIDVNSENVDSLFELAQEKDQLFKNRAAIALAILGHADKAIELYLPDENHDKYYRQLIRLTEWSLLNEDYEKAQENAWRAYYATDLRFDKLYALSLLDEGYRKQDNLDELISLLEERAQDDGDLLDLHIDLLTDLERYDEAIAKYREIEQDSTDVDARLRLIETYDIAGRADEMIEEYEQLIVSHSNQVQWYSGLASHYVSVARPELAAEVWTRFEANNLDDINVLTQGAQFMSDMGFEPEALAMIESHIDRHGATTTGQIYLFEAHFSKGRENEALAALDLLVEALPPDSGDLRMVADGYERLQRFEQALEVFLGVQEYEQEELGYDDRMRLAWLHTRIGNKDEALRLWQAIWVKEETPARRSYAEGQFLLIAAELNKLADLALEIENKLYNKTANKNELKLLIRIYTEIGDSFAATEVVENYSRYAEISAIERLKQLAQIYLQLQEFDKYDAVLRELQEIDEENRIEHIQNIVLNMVAYTTVEQSDEKLDEIQHWLKELRRFDEEAVTGEFEASVLSMSGFTDSAIESYRRALVQQPTHSDNLLLMGELLKEENRTEEAVAIFQYVAEHSKDDNEFVVAIDGILNMIGSRQFGQRLSLDRQGTFRWAHRIILERITSREDKFYLYTLLSEIASETLDREAEFIAIENSVSQAGIRRLSVLRELVTMSTPNAGFFTYNPHPGDAERQLTYGRRLIGLRQQLPPDVYISIARTLLDQEDTLGAEKSLNLIRDITGQLDVNETKADLFQEAGFTKKALASYSHALSLDQDNKMLLVKNGILREANGQREVANNLYLKGLMSILQSQPAQLHAQTEYIPYIGGRSFYYWSYQGANSNVDRNYMTYYEPFTQGLLATWPKDPEASAGNYARILDLFDEELENVRKLASESKLLAFDRYSRLSHIGQFIRRLCVATDRPEIIADMDLQLAEFFFGITPGDEALQAIIDDDSLTPEDEQFQLLNDLRQFSRHLHSQYAEHGITMDEKLVAMIPTPVLPPADDVEVEDVLQHRIEMAKENRNVEGVVRAASIASPKEPLTQIFYQFIEQKRYQEVVGYAKTLFPESEYVRLVSTVAAELNNHPQDLFRLVHQTPTFLIQLEQITGRFFETVDDFIALVEDPDQDPNIQAGWYGFSGIWEYFKTRENVNDLLAVLDYETGLPTPNGFPSSFRVPPLIEMQTELMQMELTEEQRSRLQDFVDKTVDMIDFSEAYILNQLTGFIFNFHALPSNSEIVISAAKQISEGAGLSEEIVTALESFYAGDRRTAFQTMASIENINEQLRYYWQDLFSTTFKDITIDYWKEVISGDCPSEEQIDTLMVASPIYSLSDPQSSILLTPTNIYKALAVCFPENISYKIQYLSNSFRSIGIAPLLDDFKDLYLEDTTNEGVRVALFLAYKSLEDYHSAVEVANDGGPDLTDEIVITDVQARLQENPGAFGEMGYIAYSLLEEAAQDSEDDLLNDYSYLTDQYPKSILRAVNRIRDLNEESSTQDAADAIRLFWRSLNAVDLDDSRQFYLPGSAQEMFLKWPKKDADLGYVNFYGRGFFPSQTIMNLAQYLARNPSSFASDGEIETLLEQPMKDYPLGNEFETLLQSQPSWQKRNSSSWYELLATAYSHHPESLQQRYTELTERLIDRTATDHEVTLWMFLTNETDQTLTPELEEYFGDWAANLKVATPGQMLNIARFYARLGDWQHAIDQYLLLGLSAVHYGEFQGNFGYVSYGPHALEQIKISVVIDDVVEQLPPEIGRECIHKIMTIVQRYDEIAATDHVLDSFILDTLQKVYPTEEVIDVSTGLRPTISGHTPWVESSQLLQPYQTMALISLANANRQNADFDQATDFVKPLFMTDNIESSIPLSDPKTLGRNRFRTPPGYEIQRIVNSLNETLGLSIPTGRYMRNGYSAPSTIEFIFSLRNDFLDLDNTEWTGVLISALTSWLEQDGFDHSALFEILALIAYEFKARDQLDMVASTLRLIEQGIEKNIASATNTQLSPLLELAVEVDYAFGPKLVSKAISLNLFYDSEHLTTALRWLRDSDAPGAALAAVQSISIESSGLSVLQELLEIGKLAEDVDYVSRVSDQIQLQEIAREKLYLPDPVL